MWFLMLLGSALGALNCSAYGLEEFNKVNVVTGVFSTPPLKTNRTIYFNPCAPIEGVPECGDDSYFCAIDEELIDGRWVTASVKSAGSTEAGMRELQYLEHESLTVIYAGAQWGDFSADGHLRFDCGRRTSVHIESNYVAEVPAVAVTTPRICGHRSTWPLLPHPRIQQGLRVWRMLWVLIFVVAALLVVYVIAALLSTARSRALGPLTEEAGRALYELPQQVRSGPRGLYERVTGRGTGRNAI